jgi:hypothetical protein
MPILECTDATTRSSRAEEVLVLIEVAVGEDVDLDAGEDAERGQLGVQRIDLVELGEPAGPGIETVGHGEPGRVVGDHQVLVAEGGMAARAMVAMAAPPSLQVEWLWQSPLSRPRRAAPSPRGIRVEASRATMRSGTRPAAAWVMPPRRCWNRCRAGR